MWDLLIHIFFHLKKMQKQFYRSWNAKNREYESVIAYLHLTFPSLVSFSWHKWKMVRNKNESVFKFWWHDELGVHNNNGIFLISILSVNSADLCDGNDTITYPLHTYTHRTSQAFVVHVRDDFISSSHWIYLITRKPWGKKRAQCENKTLSGITANKQFYDYYYYYFDSEQCKLFLWNKCWTLRWSIFIPHTECNTNKAIDGGQNHCANQNIHICWKWMRKKERVRVEFDVCHWIKYRMKLFCLLFFIVKMFAVNVNINCIYS